MAGTCAFVTAAFITQFYYTQYNESHIANSIIALLSEYSVCASELEENSDLLI